MSEVPNPERTPITPDRVRNVDVVVPPQLRHISQTEVMELWNNLREGELGDKKVGLEELLSMFQRAAEFGYKFAALEPPVESGAAWDSSETQLDK